jgi:hypothetical protein
MKWLAVGVAVPVALSLALSGAPAAEPAHPRPTPIIAELYADPAVFVGKSVMIYGLVVEISPSRTEFFLQDVSQHPLRIVGNKRLTAKIGDQLVVVGRLRIAGQQPYLAADSVTATRVLGGGGCC